MCLGGKDHKVGLLGYMKEYLTRVSKVSQVEKQKSSAYYYGDEQ